VLVVDLSAPGPAGDLAILRAELAAYDPELAVRPAVVVGTKADLVDGPVELAASLGPDVVVVSAVRGDGLDVLLERLGLLAKKAVENEPERHPTIVLRPGKPRFNVARRADGGWEVEGRSVERWLMETDLDDEQAVTRLQAKLKKEGVDRRLAAMGARAGDDVHIRGRVFEYMADDVAGVPVPNDEEPADA
jgi:GTP-binding protein